MKIKFLTVITSLLTAAFMITSCLDDNEVETEYSSESSITAFAIKDKIETQYTEKVNGKDTTLTFTVDGTKYPFGNDLTQVTHKIHATAVEQVDDMSDAESYTGNNNGGLDIILCNGLKQKPPEDHFLQKSNAEHTHDPEGYFSR